VVVCGLVPGITCRNTTTGEKVRSQAGHGVAVHELCFSRDGKLLASAGGDGTVRLWNGSTGAPLRSLPAGSMQYAVALSPTGDRVAAGGYDGLVRLWDTQTGRPLLTLLALPPRDGEADWLAVTPEGYAVASPRLTAAARWTMGNAALPADNVWKLLANPDMIGQAMQGKEVKAPTFGK
jgi:WD40 repeat protein